MAKLLLFSDVHGNLDALVAVLGHALTGDTKIGLDKLEMALKNGAYKKYGLIINLGDVVGYGSKPNEVIALLGKIRNLQSISGNHDEAAIALLEGNGERLSNFNDLAKISIEKTAKCLTEQSINWLNALRSRTGFRREYYYGDLAAFHSGPGRLHDKYIIFLQKCQKTAELHPLFYTPENLLDECNSKNIFVGHTHFVGRYIAKDMRVVRNIGSVGAPRDDDRRPAYATFDTSTGTSRLIRVDWQSA